MSYFWFGDKLDDFLIKGLDTKSWTGLVGICVGLLSLALLYEGLHLLKQFFLNRFLKIRKGISAISRLSVCNVNNRLPSSETSLTTRNRRRGHNGSGDGEPAPRSLLEESENTIIEDANTSARHILGLCSDRSGFLYLGVSSILHSIYVFIGFTLMNAVMTFNVWVMIAICLGIGLGYFFFGNHRRTDNLMHPFGTETTSLNESESTVLPGTCGNTPGAPGPGGDAAPAMRAGGRFAERDDNPTTVTVSNNRNQQGPSFWTADQDLASGQEEPNESARLIVGAEVHTPRIMSSSTSSN